MPPVLRSLRSINNKQTTDTQETHTHTTPEDLTSLYEKNLTLSDTSDNNKVSQIQTLESGKSLPDIEFADLNLLRQKQQKLRAIKAIKDGGAISDPHTQNALASTLIFAQYEAGTAICIHSCGVVLTCAHCFGDDDDEIQANMPAKKWLLFYDGTAVLTECRVWDTKRDLALLRIIAIEDPQSPGKKPSTTFPFVQLSKSKRTTQLPIICIGQPGRDDLESTSARHTTYDLFEISAGSLRGLVKDQDPQDNSEIGALKHDAWTYWGHSGAPLLKKDDGTLVGLHSSWDDETAMRHGVPLVAIRAFLNEHLIDVLRGNVEVKMV